MQMKEGRGLLSAVDAGQRERRQQPISFETLPPQSKHKG